MAMTSSKSLNPLGSVFFMRVSLLPQDITSHSRLLSDYATSSQNIPTYSEPQQHMQLESHTQTQHSSEDSLAPNASSHLSDLFSNKPTYMNSWSRLRLQL